jgi:hypothetical protein
MPGELLTYRCKTPENPMSLGWITAAPAQIPRIETFDAAYFAAGPRSRHNTARQAKKTA